MGWTCIGLTEKGQGHVQTNLARTYFSTGETEMSKVNDMLRRFWEVDSSGVEKFPVKNDEDRMVLSRAQESVKFVNGRYRIATPWKDTVSMLPNNYLMALNRLRNLEKRLQRILR